MVVKEEDLQRSGSQIVWNDNRPETSEIIVHRKCGVELTDYIVKYYGCKVLVASQTSRMYMELCPHGDLAARIRQYKAANRRLVISVHMPHPWLISMPFTSGWP